MEQNRSYLYIKFEDGAIPTGQDFADFIDSALIYKDDGLTSYKGAAPGPLFKRFGIGDETPAAPLGIKGEPDNDIMVSFTSNDESQKWDINLNPGGSGHLGFSIDDLSEGTAQNRFYIQPSTGFTGVGTFLPKQQLHVEGSATTDYVAAQIRNVANPSLHAGWLLGQLAADSETNPRDASFSIIEDSDAGKVERITVLSTLTTGSLDYNNVGINETQPYSTLHVTRPADDPLMPVSMMENTGILLLGQINDVQMIFDSSSIQVRQGDFVEDTDTLEFEASKLNIQPFGGSVRFFGRGSLEKQVVFGDEGKIGIGTDKLGERITLNGAITIGEAEKPTAAAPGTIRFSAGDFYGNTDGKTWRSLTKIPVTDGIWQIPGGPGSSMIYFLPESNPARVGIGNDDPLYTLDIYTNEEVEDANSVAAHITTKATDTGSLFSSTRIGLEIESYGSWNANDGALNIGLYVSKVDNGANSEANLAAVLNGNVVVGETTGEPLIGSNGTNVLSIQNGSVPTSSVGSTTTGGVQLFSSNQPLNPDGGDVSVFSVMTGNGDIVQLFRQGSIEPNNPNVPNTGNVITDDIIINIRQRVLDLETRLRALGMLE